MTNFGFLLSDPQFATFSQAAVAAEKIYAIDPAACVLNCRRCMEFAVTAERIFHIDPAACVLNCRRALEFAVK